MTTNIVCSNTYLDAFLRLDKKTQKKSLETIRLMQRSLRSDSLKIEKLNTKLNFKSVRVTQDYRAIFTQSGNTVLLVYIAHHDDAYLWASKRLKGFDVSNTKPVYEYFEQAKKDTFDSLEIETTDLSNNIKSNKSSVSTKSHPETNTSFNTYNKTLHNNTDNEILSKPIPSQTEKSSLWSSYKKLLFALLFFCLGTAVGIIVTIIYFNLL